MSMSQKFNEWLAQRAFHSSRIAFLEDMGEVLVASQSGMQQRLLALADRNRGKSIEIVYRAIYQKLNRGLSLGEAVRPYFSRKEYQLIGSYDQGDDAQRGQGFLTAAKILEPLDLVAKGAIRLMISAAVSAAIVISMWVGVAGSFAKDMEQVQPRKNWPAVSKAVIGSGEFLAQNAILTSGFLVILVGLLIWAFPNWKGRARQWTDKHMPGFLIYKEYRSVLSLVALSSFMSAKSGLAWSFDKLAEQSNTWEREYIYEMRRRSTSQSGVGMLDVGYFSDRLIDRMTLREGSGTLEETLSYVALANASKLADNLKARLDLAVKAVNNSAMLAAGVVVIAVMMINLSTMQGLSNAH